MVGGHLVTREKWKTLFESVGLVAIVASLVFVGIETRNSTQQAVLNTRALEIAAYQDLMDNIADLNALIVLDPEIAALSYKANRTQEVLTDLEQYRYTRVLFMRFRHGDMAYFQYERGTIDEARLQSALQILSLDSPAVWTFWEGAQHNFVESYRNHINRLIVAAKVEQPPK
jgi:hypothetical protein